MFAQLFEKLTLGVAGLLTLGIGIAITAMPEGFYSAYGIVIGGNPSLLNELRAPGANLTALGAIILAGVVMQSMTRLSAGLGATVFLAYGFGRLISMTFDGAPHDGLVTALAIELVVGSLCLASFWRMSHGRRFRMINAPAA